jgi:hypothetical protein
MTPAQHRGSHTRTRPTWPTTAWVAVVAGGALVGSLVGVRALASGDGEPGGATTFTGVVTQFADDGALMCVRPKGDGDAPFCDLYYVPPGTPAIDVGDRVEVTTIASRAEDGSRVSGMLVSPLP